MCDFTDSCETGDEIGIRRSVESFLGGILDRVVQLDEEQKEKRAKDSAETFYHGLVDSVISRLENQWKNDSVPGIHRGEEVLPIPSFVSNGGDKLPTPSKALGDIIPLSNLVVPKAADGPTFDKGLRTYPGADNEDTSTKESFLCRSLKAPQFKKKATKTDKDFSQTWRSDLKKERGSSSEPSSIGIAAALKCVLPVASVIVPDVKGHLQQTAKDKDLALMTKLKDKKTKKYKIWRWNKKDEEFHSNSKGDKKATKPNQSPKGLTYIETTLKSHLPAMLKTPSSQTSLVPNGDAVLLGTRKDDLIKTEQTLSDGKTTTGMIDDEKTPKFKLLTRMLKYFKGRVHKAKIPPVAMDTSEIMELGELELEFNFKGDIEKAELEHQECLLQKQKTVGQKLKRAFARVGLKCYKLS